MNEENKLPEAEKLDQENQVVDVEVDPVIYEAFQKQKEAEVSDEKFLQSTIEELEQQQSLPSKAYDLLLDNPATRAAIAAGATKGIPEAVKAFQEYSGLPGDIAPTPEEVVSLMGIKGQEAPQVADVPAMAQPSTLESAAAMGVSALDPTMLIPGKTQVLGAKKALTGAGQAIGAVAKPIAVGASKAFLAGLDEASEYAKILAGMDLGKQREGIFRRVYGSAEEFQKAVSEANKNILKTLSPDLVDGLKTKLKTASKIQLPVKFLNSSVLFGSDEFIAALEKFKGQSKVVPSLENHREAIRYISGQLSNSIARAATRGMESIPTWAASESAMGAEVLATLDRKFKDISEAFPITYKSIATEVANRAGTQLIPPSVRIDLLTQLKEEGLFLSRMKQAVAKGEKEQYSATIDEVKELVLMLQKPDASLDQLTTRLDSFGNLSNWALKDGKVSVNEKSMKKLYKMTQKAVEDTVGILGGPELLDELIATNSAYTNFLTKREILLNRLGGKRGDDVYKALFNPKEINAYQSDLENLVVLGEGATSLANKKKLQNQSLLSLFKEIGGEEADQIVNAGSWNFIESLLKEKYSELVPSATLADLAQNKVYLFPRSLQNWQANNDMLMKLAKMGAVDPEDLNEVTEILALGDAYGYPILNFSNTETARQISDMKDAVTMPMNGVYDTAGKAGKSYVAAIMDRVSTSKLISSAQKEALFRVLDNPMQDVIDQWGPEAADMLAKLWSQNTRGDAKLTLAEIYPMFQNARRAEDKRRKIAPYTMGPVEIASKLFITSQRLHGQGDKRPIYVPQEQRQEFIKLIRFDENMSNLQKVKNIMSLKNFGYLLDLSKQELIDQMPKPQPGPRPEAVKKTAADLMKEQVFKPEQE